MDALLSDGSNTVEFSITKNEHYPLIAQSGLRVPRYRQRLATNEKHFRGSKKTQFIGNKHFGLFSTPQVWCWGRSTYRARLRYALLHQLRCAHLRDARSQALNCNLCIYQRDFWLRFSGVNTCYCFQINSFRTYR